MEKLADLPPTALITLGITLAVIVGVRYLGLWHGERAPGAASNSSARVAAMIVDPTAINRATAALEAVNATLIEHNMILREMSRIGEDAGDELGRLREEMRISREVRRN